jgi:hypothetical protein
METGKMKQATYIFAFTLLLANATFAQLHTSMVTAVALAKPAILSDVNLSSAFINNTAQVSWQATQQTKVRRYELEKSNDGENFFYLTSFAGSEKIYAAEDNSVFTGTTHYRLRIVDMDGNILYSNIESLNTKKSTDAVRILPTRLDDNKLHIWVPANTSISSASIYGADGTQQRKAVMNQGTNIAIVDISGMAAGVYNLTVQTNKGETLKLKFTK